MSNNAKIILSNKNLLLALALFAPDEVTGFAIPSSGKVAGRTSCQDTTLTVPGDTYTTLAERCHISQNQLLDFNPHIRISTHITPEEVICCTKGIRARSGSIANGNQDDSTINNQQVDEANRNPESNTQTEDDNTDQDGNQMQGSGDQEDGQDNTQDPPQDTTTGDQQDGDGQDGNGDGDGQDGNGDGDGQDNNGDGDGQDSNGDGNDNTGKNDNNIDGENKNGNNNGTDKGDTADRPHLILPGRRTGNWTNVKCDDPAVDEFMDAEQRWGQLGAPAAFADAMDQFRNTDRAAGISLLSSVFHTFGLTDRDCSSITGTTCNAISDCTDAFERNGTGAAAMVIQNSFTNIHNMYSQTYRSLYDAKVDASFALDSFMDTFAPIKPPKDDSQWLQFFLEIITMGATAGCGKIIKGAFDSLPKLKSIGRSNEAKAMTESLLGGMTDKLTQFNKDKKLDNWDLTQQHDLKATFGEVFKGWANLTSAALTHVFDGSTNEAIDRLGNLINGGKMLTNNGSALSGTDATAQFTGMMFSVAVPLAWRLSGNLAFIIDTGAKCDAKDLKDVHFDQKDFASLSACVEDKLYYLAMVPEGPTERCPARTGGGSSCNKDGFCLPFTCPKNGFVKPPGADSLNGDKPQFGNIKAVDIITGSVRTFKANGNKNDGAKPVDYTSADSILGIADPQTFPIPGVFRLPVCSPDTAWKSWNEKTRNADNYPC